MAIDSKKYRDYLHQVRSHPESPSRGSIGKTTKYFQWSIACSLVMEWILETQVNGSPPGLVFPFGFFLFWVFFYTYRQSEKIQSVTKPSVEWSHPKKEEVPLQKTGSPQALPREVENALSLLGLKGCRDWGVIHKRYRELAKKFHPDLNPDITTAGNRFIIYDGAYRRLNAVKEKYFKS